jgi:hypothetical protein
MSTWIPMYVMFLVVFVVVTAHQRSIRHFIAIKNKRKRGMAIVTNEILKKFIGRNCHISIGTFGTSLIGVINDINENWIEVKTKKEIQLVNAEFVQSIKVVDR